MGGISIPSAFWDSEIEHELELAGPHHRQIGSLSPLRIRPHRSGLVYASCRQSPKPVILIGGIAPSALKMIAPGENGPPTLALSARAFLAHPTRFERVTFAVGALLPLAPSPARPLPSLGQPMNSRICALPKMFLCIRVNAIE